MTNHRPGAIYLEDANGTLYVAQPAKSGVRESEAGLLFLADDDQCPADADWLYRLTVFGDTGVAAAS